MAFSHQYRGTVAQDADCSEKLFMVFRRAKILLLLVSTGCRNKHESTRNYQTPIHGPFIAPSISCPTAGYPQTPPGGS